MLKALHAISRGTSATLPVAPAKDIIIAVFGGHLLVDAAMSRQKRAVNRIHDALCALVALQIVRRVRAAIVFSREAILLSARTYKV